MNFRQGTLDDLELIHKIRRAAVFAINSKDIDKSECRAWADARTPEYFAPRVEAGLIVIVENESGEAIAWGSSEGQRVEGIYVSPTSCHCGIGRQLMDQTIRYIVAQWSKQARVGIFFTLSFDCAMPSKKTT